jgi:hypothetical protein
MRILLGGTTTPARHRVPQHTRELPEKNTPFCAY